MTRLSFVRHLSGALFASLAALPVWGQSTLDPFADPVQAEVLPGWQLPDGRRVVGLQLTLEPGWKTYWRAPGDAGIPPAFDWSKARNLRSVSIAWPTPEVHVQNGMRSIGYSDVFTIPMTLEPKSGAKPVRLRGRMDLGVCADVCMPHSLTFDATLDHSETKPTPKIAAALADVPYSAREAGVKSAVCRVAPTSDGMQIQAEIQMPHTGGREVAIIEPGMASVWVSETKAQRKGNTLTAVSEMIHENGGAFGIDRSAVRITILGSDYAVDVRGCTGG